MSPLVMPTGQNGCPVFPAAMHELVTLRPVVPKPSAARDRILASSSREGSTSQLLPLCHSRPTRHEQALQPMYTCTAGLAFSKNIGSRSIRYIVHSHKSADPHYSRERSPGVGCFYQINLCRLLQTSSFLRDFQILRTLHILQKKEVARSQATKCTVFAKL